jgi:hypothetical protein
MKKRSRARILLVMLMVLALSMGVFGCGKTNKEQQNGSETGAAVNAEEYKQDSTETASDTGPETIQESETDTEPDAIQESEADTGQETIQEFEGDTEPEDILDFEIDTEPEAILESETDTELEAIQESEIDAESDTKSAVISDTTSESESENELKNSVEATSDDQDTASYDSNVPDEDGVFTSKDDVALYIHVYGKLPSNFITKKQAKKLGWSGGSLEDYAPGKCIGGDYFGNYEGLLPKDQEYYECDIDTLGKKKRGAKRIIYSDEGYIYYTDDHYESFELLYSP